MRKFGMFTTEGDQLVERIAKAGQLLAEVDGERAGWKFAYRKLRELAAAEGYEEATDTVVREIVYGDIVRTDGTVEFYLNH